MNVTTIDRKLDVKLHTPSEGVKKKVLIVMIGWAGSNYRYLSKYLDIYLNQGYSILTYIPSELECFLGFQRYSRAKVVLEILHNLKSEYTGILWHIFSNNGGFFVDACMRLIKQNSIKGSEFTTHANLKAKVPRLSDIRGMVVDSAPSLMESKVAIDAMRLSFRNPIVFYIMVVLFLIVVYSMEFKDKLLYSQDSSTLYWNSLGNEKYPWPYLVLYSSKDIVVPPTDIEKFINKLKKENKERRVEVHKFEDCPHVQLYKVHKDEYTKVCLDFASSLE